MGHTVHRSLIETAAADMRRAKEQHLQALATMNDQIKAIASDRVIGGQTRFSDKNGEPITAARLIAETIQSDFHSADAVRGETRTDGYVDIDSALFQNGAAAGSISISDVMDDRAEIQKERDDLRKRLVAAEAVNHTLRSWLAQGKVDYARGYADGLAAAAKASAVAVKSSSPQASVNPQDAAVGRAITQKGQRP